MTRFTKSDRWSIAAFAIYNDSSKPFTIHVSGRNRWALHNLMAAGAKGCTPIDNPAPRWSGYVHDCRNLGVNIETLTKPHGGDFKGSHARYVLRSKVVSFGGAA